MRQRLSGASSFYTFIASVGYIGFSPFMPGTFASMATSFMMYICYDPSAYVPWLVGTLLLLLLGIGIAEKIEKQYHLKDPSWIVLDEVVAMVLLLMFVPHVWHWYCAAFALFRFFDITKCAGIWYIDQFSGGLPLMLDDIIAAVWSLLIIRLACFVL